MAPGKPGVSGCPVQHDAPAVKRSNSSISERHWIRPDLPSKCTWSPTSKPEDDPHIHRPVVTRPKIMSTVLAAIGGTPLVQLNKIPKEEGVNCQVLAKCEFFNSGGSVKDRIALRMVEQAEKDGFLKPGDTIIEPTSGNTGVGLALTAAVKGYRCIIVMPEKMSSEKVNILRALGAEIVRTPNAASFDSPESHIGVAWRLKEEIGNAHILDQYRNSGNPLAHYDGTAQEIIDSCDGKIDLIVAGAGTGGTVSGIARKIKEQIPNCKIVAIDPEGSSMAQPPSMNETDVSFYEVEGIGYDFMPTVCDINVVDKWYKSTDKPSFRMARRLIRDEGLLCGGSSGTSVYIAMQACREFNLTADQRCVVILPDSIRNYMTKHLSDDWMSARGFVEDVEALENDNRWWHLPVSALNLQAPLTISPDMIIQEVLELMSKEAFDQVPVIEDDGSILGMATIGHLMSQITKRRVKISDPVRLAVYKQFSHVSLDTELGKVSKMLDIDHYLLVVHKQRMVGSSFKETVKTMIFGIATRIDLLNFIASMEARDAKNDGSASDESQ